MTQGAPLRRCPGCKSVYRLDMEGEKPFAIDNARRRHGGLGDAFAGFQSWCGWCKDNWEVGAIRAWQRNGSMLESNGWTFTRYVTAWLDADSRCYWCGAGLCEWQRSGHRLDRYNHDIDSHHPLACTLACWPCNHRRGRDSLRVWVPAITEIVKMYGGRGNVEWGDFPGGPHGPWRRTKSRLRDLTHCRVPDPQLEIPGFNVALVSVAGNAA